MPEFKISENDGNERQGSTVSISIMDMKPFNKIKGFLAFKAGRKVESQEVMNHLISTWYNANREVNIGDSE